MDAPIQTTSTPPSHLYQAKGKPATVAQRRANAASRAAMARSPGGRIWGRPRMSARRPTWVQRWRPWDGRARPHNAPK
eukprot:10237501-Lingulodinium_polyedra.AAC.1